MTNELYRSIRKKMKKELDPERYRHTLGVAYTAQCLAMRYGYDLEKAYLAGLLHDCAKCIPDKDRIPLCKEWNIELSDVEKKNHSLLHAKMGAYLAEKKYDITDEEVLLAIRYHTTGRAGMTTLEKIVFTADFIEPNRNPFPKLAEIRETAFVNIDKAIGMIARSTIDYVISKNQEVDLTELAVAEYYESLSSENSDLYGD